MSGYRPSSPLSIIDRLSNPPNNMPPLDQIKAIEKELDEKFLVTTPLKVLTLEQQIALNQHKFKIDEIKSFFRAKLIALLEADVKERKALRDLIFSKTEDKEKQPWNQGYYAANEDVIDGLEAAIKALQENNN